MEMNACSCIQFLLGFRRYIQLLQRSRGLVPEKLVDLDGDQIADMTKGDQALFLAARQATWVGEAPMHLSAGVRKDGTRLCCLVADGHHEIQGRLVRKSVNAFRPLLPDVNVQFKHGLDRERMDPGRVGARAENRVGGSSS